MEKKTPHCKLPLIRSLIESGKVRSTFSAHADHRIWQDVYRPRTNAGVVYLKLTVVDHVLIVSFKES
jgi:motility quorum-sensing regulator/GCU-specific mRNA interferase toxin